MLKELLQSIWSAVCSVCNYILGGYIQITLCPPPPKKKGNWQEIKDCLKMMMYQA